MLAKTASVAFIGTEARLIDVEIHVATGLPCFRIVGLPAKSVQEAEQRTRSALVTTEERWPPARIVANLAPGALRKDGTHFDLPLALGTLAGDGRIPNEALTGWVVLGELALDGSVRPVPGALAAAIACREAGRRGIICPSGNAPEAALVDGIDVVPVGSLKQCIEYLRGDWIPPPVEVVPPVGCAPVDDMSEVRGQAHAKRALEIAAAGGHNALLFGPPGAGKTMLARRVPSILPRMSMEESLEVTRIYSVAGALTDRPSLIARRPFRLPLHNISVAGLVGGGTGLARPGEASLAHHGVLFLDELPLYRSDVIESLRAPLEEGLVRIARSGGVITFPCRFSLVAAMNPCSCGYLGDEKRPCTCSDHQLRLYRAKLSGPVLDRIDIQAEVKRLKREELLGASAAEPSEVIRSRVEKARSIQVHRYGSSLITNASAPRSTFERTVQLSRAAKDLLGGAVDGGLLTGRGLDRVLRLARTMADLDEKEGVQESHVGDALGLRLFEAHDEVAA